MRYKIVWLNDTLDVARKWAKSSVVLHKKLRKVMDDIAQHPRTGIAHPEPLLGRDGIVYSRRISASDRIVYEIRDEEIIVLVVQLGGHYDDK